MNEETTSVNTLLGLTSALSLVLTNVITVLPQDLARAVGANLQAAWDIDREAEAEMSDPPAAEMQASRDGLVSAFVGLLEVRSRPG